jgi:hypothetical protein
MQRLHSKIINSIAAIEKSNLEQNAFVLIATMIEF